MGHVRIVAPETHIFDSRGRLIRSWYTCLACESVHPTEQAANSCCSIFRKIGAPSSSQKTTASSSSQKIIEWHTCLGCGASFPRYEMLEDHLERWHEGRRAREASLGEGQISCDGCGRVTGKIVTLYFGEHGEKVDLCAKCIKTKRTRVVLKI